MLVLYFIAFLCLSCRCCLSFPEDTVFNFSTSYGDYEDEHEPFIWSSGIPSLHISFKSNNVFNTQTETLHVILKLSGESGTEYSNDLVLNPTHNPPFCFINTLESINFLQSNSCVFEPPDLTATALLPMLNESFDMSKFSIYHASTPLALGETHIFVKECEETENGTIEEIEVLKSNGDAIYNATGECACKANNSKLYKDGKNITAMAKCNAFTKWSGCKYAQCWFAPIITYVSQGSNYSNTSANLKCPYEYGFPEETNQIFLIGNEIVLWDKILNSSNHNMQYRCEADNDYTRDIGKPVVSFIQLKVFFSPEITKLTESPIVIGLNNRTNVSFDFQANPASGNIITKFSMLNNGPMMEKTFEKNFSDVNYNVQYTITINSSMDYGNYIFTVRTYDPNGTATVSIKIVNETVTLTTTASTTTTNPETLYTVIGCSGAVVLIIVLVVFLIIYRKRKGKSASDEDIKEERENPLYGSAPGPSPNAEYATVDKSKKKQEKEEKVNPIYQGTSAGADADTVEEAYAAIDIKKKRKKKEKNNEGSENSAFDPEATYAAVNKPKKNKNVEPPPDVVYSAVQKKKKNDQPSDTDLHV